MSTYDRHYHRRVLFEEGRRYLAAQGSCSARSSYSRPSPEVWVYVAFAILANFVSRSFGWMRVFAYWAFLLSIGFSAFDSIDFEMRHWFMDVMSAAYLFRSFCMLLKRECNS